MAPYSTRGVHGQTVETIARRIVGGSVPPGTIIDTAALQQELDVSLTVLREAMRVLSAKGLVDARPKRGTFVRPRSDWNLLDGDVLHWQAPVVSDQFLAELGEVRAALEPSCAQLAASRRTDEDLAALDAALEAMTAAGQDPDLAVAADLSYHRALFVASHNDLMLRLEMVLQAGLARRDQMVHSGPAADPVPVHRAVVEAIRDADPDRAQTAMRHLLDVAAQDAAAARS
ncbi:FadR/GntR family transcriptional regulator [Fodinicola feengrottensis]|uniref:FadR/GntR family transcriptional regulator n=1 Tax=Fodinicola feengrottensis TaxID=435914 RepID=A0ABN2J884_9ACTN|nr:FadR/GntR family transcriptional regulator [Fodinicola feengrottensis]